MYINSARVGEGTYFNGLCLVTESWTWRFHYCCQTNENGTVGYGDIDLGRRKWHHVAITLENGVSGTNLKLTAYLDYEQSGTVMEAGSFPLEDYHFLRIGQKDKSNSTFLIDEVRISKGALGVADFLRLKGPTGTVLLFR